MKFQKQVSLKEYTTFKIGGPAKYFCVVRNKNDLIEAVSFAKKSKLPYFILGAGSNLLVSDKGFKGLVVKFQVSGFRLQGTKIFADAGLALSKLVSVATDAGLSGLEWAAGIPGTVGGAVRGNAGAFGPETKDSLERAEVFDKKDLRFKIYGSKDCKFAYRSSIFKKNPDLIIFSCEFRLKKADKSKIEEKIKEYLDYREQRHPKEPSAGSVFKNTDSGPAAILIHRCGLTGKKIGKAQVSKIHSNFIVNLGGAKAKDVLELIDLIKEMVKNKFGIEIEEEIQLLGKI